MFILDLDGKALLPKSKENAAQTPLAVSQGRVGAAHVRLYLLNCTTGVFRVAAVEVRTGRERLFCLRIDPDPAKTVHAVEKVLSALLPPALQISGGGM
ncbi:MAG: hypothetical protein A2091_07950 [Desulfuromonadales bacterium GWD2_61_12]|nr:MAG: hypothetical protein A2005_03260 [Desulfuromonadales bacterium GWC2_61_20]OGR36081.1 MAG: hypothetical protein A2091_07950 [Desulfuromonadales bacterium GWD2_61_12]